MDKYIGFENIEQDKVQIQIKNPLTRQSKSFTIYNTDVDDVFNRIYFTFKCLEKADDSIKIKHYKKNQIVCGGENVKKAINWGRKENNRKKYWK